jgi:hypothetical protein
MLLKDHANHSSELVYHLIGQNHCKKMEFRAETDKGPKTSRGDFHDWDIFSLGDEIAGWIVVTEE